MTVFFYWLVMSILFFDILFQWNKRWESRVETDAEADRAGTVDAETDRARSGDAETDRAGSGDADPDDEEGQDPYADILRLALTFDDGPHPVYTPLLLDGLQERGVKATFFVTGENALEYPELIERIHEEGHLIGNHTYSHVELSAVGQEVFLEELERTNQVLENLIGEEIIYARPPYGEWNREIEELCNMFPVLWDVDSLDWYSKNTSAVVRRVLADVGDGDIILMHDGYQSTVEAALYLIDELAGQGYEFVTVDELLLD